MTTINDDLTCRAVRSEDDVDLCVVEHVERDECSVLRAAVSRVVFDAEMA